MRYILAMLLLSAGLRGAPEYPQMGPDIYDVQANGARQIDAALAQARAGHKRVLVDFGANWCIWCRRLNHTIETNPQVSAKLRNSYVFVMVDVNSRGATPHNADLNPKYGNPLRFGVPVLIVLDAAGRLLTTKDSGELEEGDHHSPEKILSFLSAWSLITAPAAGGWAPATGTDPSGAKTSIAGDKPEIHGAITLGYGAGSGGYSEKTSAIDLYYTDPDRRFVVGFGYGSSLVKFGNSDAAPR
jgi:thiol-disulfide isomerase/thioredoxin